MIDGFVAAARAGLTWGWLTALIGLLPGITLWAFAVVPREALLANTLSPAQRTAALGWGAASLVVTILLYALAHVRARARDRTRRFGDTARRANALAFVALAAPLPLLLTHTEHALRRPWLLLSAMTTIGIMAAVFSYRAYERWPRLQGLLDSRRARALVRVAAVAVTGIVTLALCELALIRHGALATNTYDLGIFTNIVWNSSQGRPLACSFLASGTHASQHFDPILVLLSPLAWLPVSLAEALVVFQCAWLGLGAWPLYRIATTRLGHPGYGLAFALIYLLYPPLAANALWDVHSLSLGVPLILWLALTLESPRARAYVAALALTLLVREEFALIAAIYGMVGLLGERPRRGLWTVLAALGYLAIAWLLIAPEAGAPAHARRYQDMLQGTDGTARALAVAALANPAHTLAHALTGDKTPLLAALLVPLLGLPLAAGRWLLPAALGAAFIMLATSLPVSDLFFHYTAALFPVLMAAAPIGLARLCDAPRLPSLGVDPVRLRPALTVGALAASLAFTCAYGVFSPFAHFRAGFKPVTRELSPSQRERLAWLTELARAIPHEASVAASGYLGPHLAERPRVYHFPDVVDADYLLVWTPELGPPQRQALADLRARGRYEPMVSKHQIVLLRRVDRTVPPLIGGPEDN
ncbi:MAG: DUF2079 domain-containing protein [Nannocystaceae bacterium]